MQQPVKPPLFRWHRKLTKTTKLTYATNTPQQRFLRSRAAAEDRGEGRGIITET